MASANGNLRVADARIKRAGTCTRAPGPPFFFGGGGGLKNTVAPFSVDVPAVVRVRYALAAGGRRDYVIAGHSHFDHTYATAPWSPLTNAPIIGGITTCRHAQAARVPPPR